MKKMPATTAVVAFTLIFCMMAAAPAGGYKSALPRESGGEPYEYMLLTLLQLRLSDPQKRDIALVLREYQAEMKRAIGKVVEARQRLIDAIDADRSDESAVRQASRRVADGEERLALIRAQIEGELRGLLTPDQQTIMRDMKVDVSEKIRERIENRLSLLDQWIEDHSR